MIVMAFDPGPTSSGYAIAELTREMRGRPKFIRGGKVGSGHADILFAVDSAPDGATIAVETPSGYIHEHARGAALLETRGVASAIATIARIRGRNVVEMPATEWRRHFTGKANASDALIKRACATMVFGLPNQSSPHLRDALGLSVVVLRQNDIVRGS